MATPHMHVYQRPNDEAKQACATTAYSSFCVEAFAITKVSRLHAGAGEKLACWTEGFSTADLELDNFGASLTGSLVFCTHSSRLSLFCSDYSQGRHYFRGRQTVENHLVHTGTNLYHIMTSSIPSWFIFSRFIFSWKLVCPRKSQKFAPSENFPLYGISVWQHMTHASSILWSLSVLFWLNCPWQIISSLVHLSNIVGIVCIYVVRKDCGTVCMIWNQKSSRKLEILCKCIKWSAPLLDLVHKWRPTFMIIQSTADTTLPHGWNSVPVENVVKSKLAIALYPTTWGYVSYILNWMRQSQKAHSGRSRAHLAVSTERVLFRTNEGTVV